MSVIVPSEAEEAKALVAYLRLKGYRFTHIANETGSGKGAKWQGIRNKRMGVSKGFVDYLVIKDGKLLAIELKRVKSSHITPEQKQWIEDLNNAGVPAKVCKGCKEAIEFVEKI